MDGGEELGIRHVGRLGLLGGLALVVHVQQVFWGEAGFVCIEQGLESVQNSGLPVYEGSVDIKGEEFEVGKFCHVLKGKYLVVKKWETGKVRVS